MGEVLQFNMLADKWELILTAWGYEVEDDLKLGITAEELHRRGWSENDILPHRC